jgi:hypothetical protein
VVVMRLVVASGRRPVVGLAVAGVAAAMPPMQITTSWATCCITTPAMLLAIWAALLAERGRTGLRRRPWLCPTLIYQPAAMGFWVPVAIDATGSSPWPLDRARTRRHLVPCFAAGLIALTGWAAAAGIGRAKGRSELALNPPSEISWFFGPSPAACRRLGGTSSQTDAVRRLWLSSWSSDWC